MELSDFSEERTFERDDQLLSGQDNEFTVRREDLEKESLFSPDSEPRDSLESLDTPALERWEIWANRALQRIEAGEFELGERMAGLVQDLMSKTPQPDPLLRIETLAEIGFAFAEKGLDRQAKTLLSSSLELLERSPELITSLSVSISEKLVEIHLSDGDISAARNLILKEVKRWEGSKAVQPDSLRALSYFSKQLDALVSSTQEPQRVNLEFKVAERLADSLIKEGEVNTSVSLVQALDPQVKQQQEARVYQLYLKAIKASQDQDFERVLSAALQEFKGDSAVQLASQIGLNALNPERNEAQFGSQIRRFEHKLAHSEQLNGAVLDQLRSRLVPALNLATDEPQETRSSLKALQGKIELQAGRLGKSISLLTSAIEGWNSATADVDNDTISLAASSLSEAYRVRGDFQKSRNAAELAVEEAELPTTKWKAHQSLSAALLAEGEYEAAINQSSKAHSWAANLEEHNPTMLRDTLFLIGEIHLERQHIRRAERVAHRLLSNSVENEGEHGYLYRAYFLKARTEAERGNNSTAFEALELAKENVGGVNNPLLIPLLVEESKIAFEAARRSKDLDTFNRASECLDIALQIYKQHDLEESYLAVPLLRSAADISEYRGYESAAHRLRVRADYLELMDQIELEVGSGVVLNNN